MANRIIAVKVNSDKSRKAIVRYSVDWGDYRVSFFIDGVCLTDADYHDDDKQSAMDTANHFVKACN